MNHHDHALENLVDRATPDSAPPFGAVLERRGRRRTRRRSTAAGAVAVVAVVAVVAAGSGMLQDGSTNDPDPAPAPTATDQTDAPSPPPEQVAPDWDGEGVPPATLLLAERMVVLAPWAYCYGGTCVDGAGPGQVDYVGSPDAVRFSFPVPAWEFEATFTEVGVECPRSITVPAEATSPTTFEVPPAGRAGTYDVTLFGRGDGDVTYGFRWSTPTDGQVPEPEGRVGVVTKAGDDAHIYAPELALEGLASTPRNASAEITVTAANGASRTLPAVHPTGACTGEGNLYFDGTGDPEPGLADLGPFPYTYSVRLVMDGMTYVGTATHPQESISLDELAERLGSLAAGEGGLPLDFEPPLPAYTG